MECVGDPCMGGPFGGGGDGTEGGAYALIGAYDNPSPDDGGSGNSQDPTAGGSQANSGGDCGTSDPACIGNTLPGGLDPNTALQDEPQWGSSPPGPGTEFSTFSDAAAVGSIYDYWMAYSTDSGEWVSEIYKNADGTYSFDPGHASDSDTPTQAPVDPSAIPPGTDFAGWTHTHGDDGLPTFSNVDSATNDLYSSSPDLYPQYQGMGVSAPDGSIQVRQNNVSFIVCNQCVGQIARGPSGP